jgi:hypothetical protein
VTKIISGVLPADQLRLRPGASSLRSNFPGTGVPGAGSGSGTGPCAAVMRPVPRVRNQAALAVPATQFGQTNIYNHMTSAVAVGEGASGSTQRPQCRAPA